MKKIFLFSVLVGFIFSGKAQNQQQLRTAKIFHIPGNGGWDYLALSPVHDWLYVSHGTEVNIVNKFTGDSVGVIPNTTGVHGICFDELSGKGYTSNGKLNSVTVFNIQSNTVLTQIPTGLNPDAILYEPYSKRIITCNGRGKNLTIIDPANDSVVDSVEVGGKPETAVSDGEGHLFVNIEDKNEIIQVDTKDYTVVKHWSIAPADGPTGLAYDPKTKRLFAGCDKTLVVVNAMNGKIIARLPIGGGCDGVVFDPEKRTIFTANGDGTMNVFYENSADKYTSLGTIETKKGARTLTLDFKTHKLYLPFAEYEPQSGDSEKRPKVISGTFQVLVLDSN